MTDCTITSLEQLRELYGPPPADAIAYRIVLPRLDGHHRAFIASSSFMVMATVSANGVPDVSPRGDLPGFVRVIDDGTLLIPDRPGNRKLTSMTNLLASPGLALIFFVRDRDESLRVRGRASITTEPGLLAPLAAQGKAPKSGILMHVEKAYFHCGKAVIRSQLWSRDAAGYRNALPSFAQILADQAKDLDTAEVEKRLEVSYNARLWDHRG